MNTYNLKDLKNLKTNSGFSEIPEGRYNLEVVAADVKQSAAGNDMINLKMKIAEGDHKGRYIWDNLTFIENSLWKLKSFLEAANSPLLEDSGLLTCADIAPELIGYHVNAFLEPGTDQNGNPRSTPKNYKPVINEDAEAPMPAKKGLMD